MGSEENSYEPNKRERTKQTLTSTFKKRVPAMPWLQDHQKIVMDQITSNVQLISSEGN